MKFRLHHLSFVLGLAILDTAHAHDTDSQSGPLGKVSFPTSCSPKVQPQFERARRDAAFVLVPRGREDVPRRPRRRPAVHDRHVGNRGDPDVQSAGRAGRVAEGRRSWRRRRSTRAAASRRRRSASATTSKPSPRITRISRRARSARGRSRAPRPTRRWRRSTRTTTRRRSSPRSISPARNRRPTRRTRRISRRPRSSRSSS